MRRQSQLSLTSLTSYTKINQNSSPQQIQNLIKKKISAYELHCTKKKVNQLTKYEKDPEKQKKLLELLDTIDNENEKLNYCYNNQTEQIYLNIRKQSTTKQELQKQIDKIRLLIKYNRSQKYNKDQKKYLIQTLCQMEKLKRLLSLANQKIDQKQPLRQKPFSLEQYLAEYQDNLMRKLNFYFIVSWIINFLLATKDSSQCLNFPLNNTSLIFREWLLINAYGSFAVAVYFFIYNLYYTSVPGDKKKNQNGKQTLIETLAGLIVLIAFVLKYVWILIGIIIFLNLNFSQCSDNVLNYCSIQFLAYFTILLYFALNKVTEKVKNCFQYSKCSKLYKYQNKFLPKQNNLNQNKSQQNNSQPKKQISNNQIQKLQQREISLFSKEIFFYVANEDFNDLKEKVIVWTVVGWVYDFVLYYKDKSPCLDQDLSVAFTYRQWLFYDGITSVAIFGFIVIGLIARLITKSQILIWQIQKKNIFVIQKNWINNNINMCIIIITIILSKVSWVIAGVIIFCKDVNSNQSITVPIQCNGTKLGQQNIPNCSGNVPNFLLLYFTQTVYVLIEGFSVIVKGYRIKKNMEQKIKNEEQQLAAESAYGVKHSLDF